MIKAPAKNKHDKTNNKEAINVDVHLTVMYTGHYKQHGTFDYYIVKRY